MSFKRCRSALSWSGRQRLSVLQNQARNGTILAFDDVTDLVALLVDRFHAIPQIGALVMKRHQLVCSRIDHPGARRNRQQRSVDRRLLLTSPPCASFGDSSSACNRRRATTRNPGSTISRAPAETVSVGRRTDRNGLGRSPLPLLPTHTSLLHRRPILLILRKTPRICAKVWIGCLAA